MKILCKFGIYAIISYLEYVVCNGGTGPIFIVEPPKSVYFVNYKSVIIDCIVHGKPDPKITWKNRERDVTESDLVKILPNNSLYFMPFESIQYDQSIHASEYYCEAENKFGIIVSRRTRISAVFEQSYSTQVYDEYVMVGNTGVLRCRIPSYMKDFVQVVAWLKDDEVIASKENNFQKKKYLIGWNGNLYIFGTDLNDVGHTFKCKTKNIVTNSIQVTRDGGDLHIKTAKSGIAPKISDHKPEVEAKFGSLVKLPCIAQGNPPPQNKWCFKTDIKDKCKDIGSDSAVLSISVTEKDSGIYVCESKNDISSTITSTKLSVYAPLNVFIHPQLQKVEIGERVVLKCVVSGGPFINLKWLRNGRVIKEISNVKDQSSFLLEIEFADEKSNGMYQCFVFNNFEVKQATGQIILSAFPPKIVQYFTKKTARPGSRVTVKCIATGEPQPKFQWYRRNELIQESSRLKFEEFNLKGNIVSKLVIKNIIATDGGLYRCEAINEVSRVGHSEFLNVYGAPKVWPLGNVTGLSGKIATIQCHISGYPISKVSWYKGDIILRNNEKIKMFDNGTLFIKDTNKKADSGLYKCVAGNEEGFQSTGSGFLNIEEKPKLLKFNKETVVDDGGRFQLTCTAIRGDAPIKFSWSFNGKNFPYELNLVVTASVYSSVITSTEVTTKHSGNYSCNSRNKVGSVATSTFLQVEGSPEWRDKPNTTVADIGDTIILPCSGKGYPKPVVKWLYNFENNEIGLKNSSDGKYLIFKNGSLQINNFQKKDLDSMYICIISNGLSPNLRQEVTLSLKKEKIIFTRLPNSLFVGSKESSLMKCHASGNGPFSLNWITGSKILRNTNDRIRIETTSSKNEIQSTLTIISSRKSDTGLYTCKINSETISNSTSIYLQVLGSNDEKYEEQIKKNTNTPSISSNDDSKSNETNANFQIFSEALLYIIPTTTAAVVLLIILIIVCILLHAQRRRNKENNKKYNTVASRNSTLLRQNKEIEEQYNLSKASSNAYDSVQMGNGLDPNGHIYSSMSTYPRNYKGNVQPYATLNSENRKKSMESPCSTQYELQRFQ